MALYPKAIGKPITPGVNDPTIKPVGLVLHVRDGTGSSLYDYFHNKSGGIESHFYIRYDGTVEQYRDTAVEADAQYHGNSFTVKDTRVGLLSVETEGANHGAWTERQLAAIKELILWVREVHHIQMRVCPAWNEGGIGFHTMWGSPSQWTPVAKSCPGPERIRQFREIITPWLKAADQPVPAVASAPMFSEDDMREVLTHEGRAYERDGFFRRLILAPADLHRLIDPKPRGQGLPSRAVSAAELAKFIDADRLAELAAGTAKPASTG